MSAVERRQNAASSSRAEAEMKESFEAIYENGVLRPLERPGIPEGKQVRIIIEQTQEDDPDDPLELALQVYRGLSEADIDEIERIAVNRQAFFAGRAD